MTVAVCLAVAGNNRGGARIMDAMLTEREGDCWLGETWGEKTRR
jgi:hypothetical protein